MNMALYKDGCYIWVQTDREQHGGEVESLFTDDAGCVCDGEGVKVNNSVEDVAVVLSRYPIDQRAQIIAEMDRTSGLNARKDTSHAETLLLFTVFSMINSNHPYGGQLPLNPWQLK